MAETVTINVKANTTQAKVNLMELGEKISNLGMRISAAFTLPIVGAFALAINKSKELQEALKPIQDAFSGVAAELGLALIPLVKELTPSIIELANALAGVVRWFAALPLDQQKTIAGFVAFLAAVGPVISIVGQLIGTVGVVQTILTNVGIMLPGLGTAFTAFGATATAALGPLLPLLLAIAGLMALVNTEFGKRGITAGKQIGALVVGGVTGAFKGREAGNQAFVNTSRDWGLLDQPAAAGGRGGQTVIYNNYGIDANNPHVKAALQPYINQNARDRGQR